MFMDHRRQLILRRLARDGTVRVAGLAQEWNVNPMTIRRDLTDLEEKGHLRRVYGGALPTGRTESQGPLIGLMVPHTESYYGPVVAGAERAAQHLGARLVLATHFYLSALEHERLEKLVSLDLDGLVLATSGFQRAGTEEHRVAATGGTPHGGWLDGVDSLGSTKRDDMISDQVVEAIIDRMKCPVILLERQLPLRDTGVDPCVVRSAHDQGALLGLRHLRRLGHARVLAVMRSTPTVVGLARGLREARERLGLQIDAIEVDDDSDLTETARQCLAGGHRALFVHPDGLAIQLVEELTALGVGIPDDMHLVTYDDVMAAGSPIPLTAVAPAKDELGYEAVRMALHQIDSSTRPAVQHLVLTPRLMVRGSAPEPDRP